jgi:hypothetical protein
MAKAGDELVDPSGLGLRFVETAASSGGTYAVPAGALHVHPANAWDTELRVRQTVRPERAAVAA